VNKIFLLSILFLFFYSCEDDGLIPIYGCTDPTACDGTYDPNANIHVNDSCTFPSGDECDCDGSILDACGVCGGDGTGCEDCNGTPNGGLIFDECGVCDGEGIADGTCDCDGNVLDDCDVCGGDGSSCSSGVDYESEIQPIFNIHCDHCHDGDHNSGLDLRTGHSFSSLFQNNVIVEGDAEASNLYTRVESGNMPLTGSDLSESQVNTIANWINKGANP